MALLENILLHGTIAFFLILIYLLPILRFLSPRVWAMSDYPKEITGIVEPQTKEELRLGAILLLPFLLLLLIFPYVSTLILESTYNEPIPLFDAFLNTFGVYMFGNIADLVILDLLIVGTITPSWVIIPGTEHLRETEYKAFRKYHAKAHVRGTIGMAVLSLIIAVIVVTL